MTIKETYESKQEELKGLEAEIKGNHHDRYPDPITPQDIALDIKAGMPWSKAVKTELCVEFPEGLMIDDCYQHIFQCDVCETAAVIHDDLYEWLVREGSMTTTNDRKKDALWYLEIYMLMMNEDELQHSWAKEAGIFPLLNLDLIFGVCYGHKDHNKIHIGRI